MLLVAKWYEKNKCDDYVKRRLPVLAWLPRYRSTWILQDALAGITVGLTAVPQGIAYGIVAGLNAEVRIMKPRATTAISRRVISKAFVITYRKDKFGFF